MKKDLKKLLTLRKMLEVCDYSDKRILKEHNKLQKALVKKYLPIVNLLAESGMISICVVDGEGEFWKEWREAEGENACENGNIQLNARKA